MSTGLQILFNPKKGVVIEEKQMEWTDLLLLAGYEDDSGVKYSHYSHELSLYKLAKSQDHWAENEFVKEFKMIRNKFDWNILPCMVMNMDIVVGYLNSDNTWNLIGESEVTMFEENYYNEIRYIVESIEL